MMSCQRLILSYVFIPTHCQHIQKPNESYAIGTVPGLNQESGRIVKWDTLARGRAIVDFHRKRTNRRNDVDMMRGRHKEKSILKWKLIRLGRSF